MYTYIPNFALEEPEEVGNEVFFFNSNLLDLCPFLLNEYLIGRGRLGDLSANHRLDEAYWYFPFSYIYAPHVEVPFFNISSEKFEKSEQELKAYEMPITKIIEDNSVKNLAESIDTMLVSFIAS